VLGDSGVELCKLRGPPGYQIVRLREHSCEQTTFEIPDELTAGLWDAKECSTRQQRSQI
jgi:hypothetical protein